VVAGVRKLGGVRGIMAFNLPVSFSSAGLALPLILVRKAPSTMRSISRREGRIAQILSPGAEVDV
jgi:hypothetical protein